ncbi:AAA family ATPase [Listeria marthii]|uniref:AAA family ATPase n=1 Tax=Listeria marthii TaxID=529731 RepID=UPI00165DDF2E|nr:AAA family ATPase [Listeria marthii]MBF2349748.1 ATP-dependent Clp protease ATP-binding subunit [Listeria marthii]MBF2589195.1 ATP-dependent Clp protease ATP-binding subunit [Listeria marthii]
MELKVFFEPQKNFKERLTELNNTVALSECIIKWTPTASMDEVIKPLSNKDICIITTADCSGLNSHVLENFELLIKLFEAAKIKRIWIHNPPKFFLDKVTLYSPDISIYHHEYPKITEKILKNIFNQFDNNIIGQENAKKIICRKLLAHMIRPSDKPLVLMFYGKPGIGKTETAKYLSKILYGNTSILREQMTMVGGETSIKYFKATSHTEDSFSKKLLNRRSNLVLLDEFALAPQFFHTSFFQMFDEGIYMDQNFNVDVKNSIIICTSNLLSIEDMENNIDAALLSRFDGFVHFSEFTLEDKEKIMINLFDEIVNKKNLKNKYFNKISKEKILLKVRAQLSDLPNMRSIRKFMEDCISDVLMNEIL